MRESDFAVVLSEEGPREEEKYTSEGEHLVLGIEEKGRNGGADGSAADESGAPSDYHQRLLMSDTNTPLH